MPDVLAGADLKFFLDVTDELWAVLDADGTLLEHTPAWPRLLACDAAALQAQPQHAWTADDDRDRLLAALAAALAGASPEPLQLTLRGADERTHPVDVSLSPAEPGRLRLTARSRAPTTEAARLARAVNTVPIVLWQIDHEGRFVMSEGGYLTDLGLRPGQVVGLSALDLYKEAPSILELLRRGLAGEECRATSQLGDRHFSNRVFPLRDAAGAVTGAIGLAIDITAQVEAEHAVRAQSERLAQQQRLLQAMALPILQVWDGVLCVPVIGQVDESRAAAIMEAILRTVGERRARAVILDLTGLEEIDTRTAARLVDVLRGVQLLGARGMMAGIRPPIAQTLIMLGVEVAFETLGTLQDALRRCLGELDGRG